MARFAFVAECVLPLIGLGEKGISIAKEGFNPATSSPKATLLRLHPVEDPTMACTNKTTKNLCGTSGT